MEAVSWLGMLRDVTSKQNCETHKSKSSTLPGMLESFLRCSILIVHILCVIPLV